MGVRDGHHGRIRRCRSHYRAGRIIGIGLMLVGIGFLAVLTATIASAFVKSDRQDESGAILEALQRVEAELAELKTRLS